MATTSSTTGRSRTTAAAGSSTRSARASGRARGARAEARGEELDQQYDLLTAALIGVALGATATLLLRRPSPKRVIRPLAALEGGREMLGAMGGRVARRARGVARPTMEAASHVREYVADARRAIDDAVADEVRQLRRAIRKQRRRVGL